MDFQNLVIEQLKLIAEGVNTFDWINVVSSGAAAFAAIFSFMAVREMKNTRLDEFRPVLKWGGNQSNPDDESEFVFNIENHGKGICYSLTACDIEGKEIKMYLPSMIKISEDSDIFARIQDFRIFDRIYKSKKIILQYEDVYGRKFETHISLKLSKSNDGKWIKSVNQDFKQIIK